MSLRTGILTVVFCGLLVACAGQSDRPVEQLTRAQTLIDQAEKAGAQRYAAADLETARNKLSAANAAAEKGKHEAARDLATEAALDAELASARATSGQARQDAQDVSKGVETLRDEAARQSDPPGNEQR